MKGDVRLRVFKFQLWVSGRDLGLLPPAPSTHPESVMGKCNPMAPNAGACVSLVGYDMRRGGLRRVFVLFYSSLLACALSFLLQAAVGERVHSVPIYFLFFFAQSGA